MKILTIKAFEFKELDESVQQTIWKDSRNMLTWGVTWYDDIMEDMENFGLTLLHYEVQDITKMKIICNGHKNMEEVLEKIIDETGPSEPNAKDEDDIYLIACRAWEAKNAPGTDRYRWVIDTLNCLKEYYQKKLDDYYEYLNSFQGLKDYYESEAWATLFTESGTRIPPQICN